MRNLCGLALALALLPVTLVADGLTLPIDADTIYRYVTEHGITTKRGLLAALPDQVSRRVVLISDSHSLHRSTRALPRVLHWSPDARFIMSISGQNLGEAPHAGSIEIIQIDEGTEDWQFLTMAVTPNGFTPPADVTRQCTACHGDRPRPIWGEYPDWPHAYQGSLGHAGVDRMTLEERDDFWDFIASTREHEAYENLNIRLTTAGYGLRIRYGLPNTHFGARLGTRHAHVMFNRLRASPRYEALAYRLVRTSRNSRCGREPLVEALVRRDYREALAASRPFGDRWRDEPAGSARMQIYRLLGVDPLDEMRIDHSPATPVEGRGGDAAFAWNVGGDSLGALVEFQVFHDLLQRDPELQRLFRSRRELIEGTYWAAFEASATEVVELSRRYTPFDKTIKALDRRRYELVSRGGSPAAIDAELAAVWQMKHERRDYFGNGLFPFLHFNIFGPVLEEDYKIYVPMEGDGHKQAYCSHLTAQALAP